MTHDFKSVRALVRNSDSRSRDIVTGVLGILGCREVIPTDSAAEAQYFLQSEMIDLLVVDATQSLLAACDMVRQMRHRPAADNTFAVSMILSPPPEPGDAARLMESGADAILIKPINPVAVAERIKGLVHSQRPFVVTNAYVGPERRGLRFRPGSEPVQPIAVPNPLREMALGAMSRDQLRRSIRAGWEVVNEHRIERQAAHLGRLVNRVRDAFAGSEPSRTAQSRILELREAASELRLRVEGSEYHHVAHLATTMVDICLGLGRA
jgi:DNA-binding response OmpR family regulator